MAGMIYAKRDKKQPISKQVIRISAKTLITQTCLFQQSTESQPMFEGRKSKISTFDQKMIL